MDGGQGDENLVKSRALFAYGASVACSFMCYLSAFENNYLLFSLFLFLFFTPLSSFSSLSPVDRSWVRPVDPVMGPCPYFGECLYFTDDYAGNSCLHIFINYDLSFFLSFFLSFLFFFFRHNYCYWS